MLDIVAALFIVRNAARSKKTLTGAEYLNNASERINRCRGLNVQIFARAADGNNSIFRLRFNELYIVYSKDKLSGLLHF